MSTSAVARTRHARTSKKVQGGLPPIPKDAKASDVVTVNFVEDGMTAFGQIWYRGQEISVLKGSESWTSTLTDPDDAESSWLLFDEAEQIARWGARMFRPGHWEGATYDTTDESLAEEERRLLEEANALMLARSEGTSVRAVPGTEKRGPGRPRVNK